MLHTQNNITLTGDGRLQVNVFAGNIGMPAESAHVRVSLSDNRTGLVGEWVTDSSGQTDMLTLPAPPVEFSMQPDRPQPYSSYDIFVTMNGYEPVYVRGVQIFPNTTAIQSVDLHPVNISGVQPEVIPITPPTLWGSYPAKVHEAVVKPLPPSKGYAVLPDPVIPEYIVVHDGVPTNRSAKDYWVPFKDYIKNVASCEIYSTWPEETIRANVLAILSFTLNRVYTEWYRSKGYGFTITSSTAFDHAFTYGRNIFREISTIVDDLFTTFITKPDIRQPLLTQYCDGRKVQCPNWMTQWGSKALGDQGYSAINILKNAYGNDIYLMQAQKVEGIPLSFPGIRLQVGSRGPNVRVVQEQLNAISRHYPAIPRLVEDGIYGSATKASVEKFQKIFNLPSSGVTDFATWYKLSLIYVAVTRMGELR